ncbi:integrase core domain-containing protein, partial [Tepidimonas alkaliphilus]|uniref:integrase core domain-containing protein n=1 Tax=Tepidimonas alkaliphilus TaxID=2588942 RepID=UPI00163D5AED
LQLNDIEHRRTQVRRPQTNGFVERLHRSVPDEFFRVALRQKVCTELVELQRDLDAWLHHDNHERPHLGYRNNGRTPYQTVQRFVQQVRQEPADESTTATQEG